MSHFKVKFREALSTADSFSQTRMERIQQAIDAIDDQIDEPNYKLYETQALLYYAKGDILNAKRYIEDAFVLNDETATYSKTGHLLIKRLLADRKLQRADSDEKEPGANRLDKSVALASDSQESGVEHVTNEHVGTEKNKFSGKIENWLALYGLRLLLLPVIMLIDIASIFSDDLSEYGYHFVLFMLYAGIFDIALLIISVVAIYYFFKKKKLALRIKYLEVAYGIYQFTGSIWLYFLSQHYSVSLSSDISKLFFYSFISLVWALYWHKSRRVKATFVN